LYVGVKQEWILKVKESKTVQDITQSLLDLEEGLQIILSSDGKTDSKSRSAWRKALRGNQNPDSVSRPNPSPRCFFF
jgi:hypothetical protein